MDRCIKCGTIDETKLEQRKMLKLLLVSVIVASAAAASAFDGRVVGGVPAQIEDFPYQVSLQRITSHICGASVISENYILTAAHCVHTFSANSLTINGGTTIQNKPGTRNYVRRIIEHPNYNNVTQDYDMALIEVQFPWKFGPKIQPIQLADEGFEVPAGSVTIVTGWGAIAPARSTPNLLSAKLTTISRSDCAKRYEGFMGISDRMICTLEPGKDSCQGDSGGPLALDGKLVGIVSWGLGCARPEVPGVYTNVANLRKFIKEHANV